MATFLENLDPKNDVWGHRSLLFIHIPKTAGKSFRTLLEANGGVTYKNDSDTENWARGKHPTCSDALELINYRSLKKPINVLGIVRNPYDRLAAMYNQLSYFELEESAIKCSFEEWVMDGHFCSIDFCMPASARFYASQDLLDQKVFYRRYRFEHGLRDVGTQLSLRGKLPTVGKSFSKGNDYRKLYTEEMKAKAYDFYQSDFESFGYNKEY